MIYYAIDEDNLYVGERQPQRDPVASAAAGETVYFAPGARDVTVEPPEVTPPQRARWTGTEWEIVDDNRGELWFKNWLDKAPVEDFGVPADLWETREELPIENLRAWASRFVFNWAYFKKYGDNVDVMLDGVKMWSDPMSVQQAQLELAHAQSLGEEYVNHEGWGGKEGGVIDISSVEDMARIVEAYRDHQRDVHTMYQAKKAEITAAATREELYDICTDIWTFLLETGEFQDD